MTDIHGFRHRIDELDEKLARLLAARQEICRQVAEYKSQVGMPMMQPGRIKAIHERCERLGLRYGVSPRLLKQIYDLIIEESCRLETRIMESLEEEVSEKEAAARR